MVVGGGGGVPPEGGVGVTGTAGVDGVLVVGDELSPFSPPPTELLLGVWPVRRWGVSVVVPVLGF